MGNGHARQPRKTPRLKPLTSNAFTVASRQTKQQKSASAETLKEPLVQSWAMRQSMARRRSNAAQSELLDPTPKLFVYRAAIIRFRG